MKVRLLYEDSEVGPKETYVNRNEIIQDLNLDIIFKTMGRNDKYIYKVVQNVMTSPLKDMKEVLYRQEIITDCTKHYDNIYRIYEMAAQTIEIVERFTEGSKRANSSNLSNAANVLYSLELLGVLVDCFDKLKLYLDTIEKDFYSKGLRAFYERLMEDYNYHFVEEIKNSIKNMNFLSEGGEITFSAGVGEGFKARDMIVNTLEREGYRKRRKFGIVSIIYQKIFNRNVIMLDDSKLAQDAKELEAAGLAHVMKLYQGFIRELSAFFENLHYQLAFYIGAANLQIRLKQIYIPTTMPKAQCDNSDDFRFKGLYDLSLAIYSRTRPVSNELHTENMKLYIITGANQGGKSTYLRSIGVAQIMMQSGMFVPAEYYSGKLFDGIFSHFTRREDSSMNSGKLDEELSRMNRILMSVTPDSLLLMNESFATTTEREGSKIAQDVVNALYENGTTIFSVTHLFEFTKTMYERELEKAIFLSAERLEDGTRTFHIYEREPERTSYGLDLYEDIISENKKLVEN